MEIEAEFPLSGDYVEVWWEYEGIACALVGHGLHRGQVNGYVRIPENHPWRRYLDYDSIPVEVGSPGTELEFAL